MAATEPESKSILGKRTRLNLEEKQFLKAIYDQIPALHRNHPHVVEGTELPAPPEAVEFEKKWSKDRGCDMAVDGQRCNKIIKDKRWGMPAAGWCREHGVAKRWRDQQEAIQKEIINIHNERDRRRHAYMRNTLLVAEIQRSEKRVKRLQQMKAELPTTAEGVLDLTALDFDPVGHRWND